MFSLVEGWVGSYPETTGYIIPTLLNVAKSWNRADLRGRALAMADGLLGFQNNDGSFPGSFVGRLTGPRVFNTGQIIFGLLAATDETKDAKYLSAARRAGDWLLGVQSPDGAWRKCTLGNIVHVYNVRTAWALGRLASAARQPGYLDAAVANAEWALTQQLETGWFAHNAFVADSDAANLHTIAYAMQGFLELGVIAESDRFVNSARRAADALADAWSNGSLPGAYRADWSSDAQWRCLPGEAQVAVVWLRLAQITGERSFRDTAIEVLEQVKSAQFMEPMRPDWHGGLSGSLPINAPYERYCLVNWGPKFLLDSLFLVEHEHAAIPRG